VDYKQISANRLRKARTDAGLTLAALASQTETLTPERISNYEQGRRYMPPDVAKTLSRALDVNISWLLGIDDHQVSDDEKKLLALYRQVSSDSKHIINAVAEAQANYRPK